MRTFATLTIVITTAAFGNAVAAAQADRPRDGAFWCEVWAAPAQAARAWQHTCWLEGQATLAFKSERVGANANVGIKVFVRGRPLLHTFEPIFGREGLVVRGQGVTVTFIEAKDRLRVEVSSFRHKRVKVVIRIHTQRTNPKPKQPTAEEKAAVAMSSAVAARP